MKNHRTTITFAMLTILLLSLSPVVASSTLYE